MIFALDSCVLRSTDNRFLWKFAWNFEAKGMLSVERFKRGEYFPPFLRHPRLPFHTQSGLVG